MTEHLASRMDKALSRLNGLYYQWCQVNGRNEYFVRILCALYYEPELTQKELSDKYLVPRQTVNNAVQFLKREGYITLSQDAKDKRWKRMRFTGEGLSYARKELAPMLSLESYVLNRFGADRFGRLADLLFAYGDLVEEGMREEKLMDRRAI